VGKRSHAALDRNLHVAQLLFQQNSLNSGILRLKFVMWRKEVKQDGKDYQKEYTADKKAQWSFLDIHDLLRVLFVIFAPKYEEE
jgi:hypothetical protein